MLEHRASFDATITFGNGGDLTVHGFRVDVSSPDVTDDEIASLFVASLGLLMTDSVDLGNVDVFAEPHKGTRGGPSDHRADQAPTGDRFVELNHVIGNGTAASTGTRLHAPNGHSTDLARIVDVPAVVARVTDAPRRGTGVGALAALDVGGAAVLLHTGDDASFLTRAGADWLADHGAAMVGIDAADIDDTGDTHRPAHARLLAAGIPVVENLTGLGQLPPTGARFTAAPLRVEGVDAIPVRAFARLPSTDKDGGT